MLDFDDEGISILVWSGLFALCSLFILMGTGFLALAWKIAQWGFGL